MPASFESFGIKFLYPDNWKVTDRAEDEGSEGVTLELPSGGFFTIEREHEGQLDEELIEELSDSFEQEYEQIEREDIQLENASPKERAVEFRFYFLDLLVISRVVIFHIGESTYVIQMQAESRDFDANEMVFAAILKQIRG
jgi:hypothetical protein